MQDIHILALSGSLRRASYNTAAIEALKVLGSPGARVQSYPGLGELPLFNPDLEPDFPAAVLRLKAAVAEADGLIIASPEYAHGISGVMKNALDWLVSGEEFVAKPVSLVNTSPRATHAQAALREVIVTMSGNIVDDACIAIPLLSSGLGRDGILDNPLLAAPLRQGLVRFATAIRDLERQREAG